MSTTVFCKNETVIMQSNPGSQLEFFFLYLASVAVNTQIKQIYHRDKVQQKDDK